MVQITFKLSLVKVFLMDEVQGKNKNYPTVGDDLYQVESTMLYGTSLKVQEVSRVMDYYLSTIRLLL